MKLGLSALEAVETKFWIETMLLITQAVRGEAVIPEAKFEWTAKEVWKHRTGYLN